MRLKWKKDLSNTYAQVWVFWKKRWVFLMKILIFFFKIGKSGKFAVEWVSNDTYFF